MKMHKYRASIYMDMEAYIEIYAVDWEQANMLASHMNLAFVELDVPMEEPEWVLVHADGSAVRPGDEVISSRDIPYFVQDNLGQPPHKEGSTGRIHVTRADTVQEIGESYYPSVFGCKWEKR